MQGEKNENTHLHMYHPQAMHPHFQTIMIHHPLCAELLIITASKPYPQHTHVHTHTVYRTPLMASAFFMFHTILHHEQIVHTEKKKVSLY